MAYPKHFDGARFYNPNAPQASGYLELLRWKLTTRPERSPGFLDDVTLSKPRPVEGDGLRITLVNHSTVLIQRAGCNILTDPVWGERVSPLPWVGREGEGSRGFCGMTCRRSTLCCLATIITITWNWSRCAG